MMTSLATLQCYFSLACRLSPFKHPLLSQSKDLFCFQSQQRIRQSQISLRASDWIFDLIYFTLVAGF